MHNENKRVFLRTGAAPGRGLVLCGALILWLTAVLGFHSALAAEGTWVIDSDSNFRYEYNAAQGEAIVNRYIGSGASVAVPSTFKGCAVVGIGVGAFTNAGITSVSIPASVVYIGNEAFSGCESLNSVSLSEGLRQIGEMAFYHCEALTSCALPSTLESLGMSAFEGDSSLQSISMSGSVGEVPVGAFSGCDSLVSVTLGEGINRINDRAFYGAGALLSIELPQTLSYIGEQAFSCTGLTEVVVPGSVIDIGPGAFRACAALRQVTLCEEIAYISEYAFCDCADLDALVIPASVYSVGGEIVTRGVTQLSVAPENQNLVFLDGALITTDGTELLYLETLPSGNYTVPAGVEKIGAGLCAGAEITSLTLPESVKYIRHGAFEGCTQLREVNLPSSVNEVGAYAFSGCTGVTRLTLKAEHIRDHAFVGMTQLQTLTLGGGLIDIEDYAFQGCTALSEFIAPQGLTSIGAYAFSGDSALNTVSLPSGLDSIGDYAFQNCGLTMLDIPVEDLILGERVFYNVDSIVTLRAGNWALDNIADIACASVRDLIVADGVERIPDGVFSGSTALESVSLPDSVRVIGENAFRSTGIRSLVLPAGLELVDYNGFANCLNLKDVVVRAGNLTINDYAFENCGALSQLLFTRSGVTLNWGCFYGCGSLRNVYLPQVSSVDRPFYNNTTVYVRSGHPYIKVAEDNNLSVVVLPDEKMVLPAGMKQLEEEALSGVGAQWIVLPDGCQSVGSGAFSNCSQLRFITIPASVSHIAADAFDGLNGCVIFCASGSEAARIADALGMTWVAYDSAA